MRFHFLNFVQCRVVQFASFIRLICVHPPKVLSQLLQVFGSQQFHCRDKLRAVPTGNARDTRDNVAGQWLEPFGPGHEDVDGDLLNLSLFVADEESLISVGIRLRELQLVHYSTTQCSTRK